MYHIRVINAIVIHDVEGVFVNASFPPVHFPNTFLIMMIFTSPFFLILILSFIHNLLSLSLFYSYPIVSCKDNPPKSTVNPR